MNVLPLETRTVGGWKILCVSHNPSPPSTEPRGVFLQSLAGEACEGLVAKAWEVWVLLGVPASHPLRLPSGFASAPLSERSHHLVACFSLLRITRILGDESLRFGGSFSCDLRSLADPRKSLDCHFVYPYLVRTEMTSQLFTCPS